jgi:hypothetical protein
VVQATLAKFGLCVGNEKLNIQNVKVKVKVSLEQAMKAQKGSTVITLLFSNLNARWGGWAMPCPGCFTATEETQYLLYKRLGGGAQKICASTRI